MVGVAPIDASGTFALYANPGTGPMASIVANAIQNSNGWVNFDLQEIGANGTMTLQSVSRQFAGGLNQPVSEGSINSNTAGEANIGTWQGDGAISDNSPIADGSTTVDSSTYVVLRQALRDRGQRRSTRECGCTRFRTAARHGARRTEWQHTAIACLTRHSKTSRTRTP